MPTTKQAVVTRSRFAPKFPRFSIFSLSQEQKDVIIKRVRQFMNFDTSITILEVDFAKPWYSLLLQQPLYLALNIVNQSIFRTYSVLFPLAVGYLVTFNRLDYLIYLVFSQIIIRVISHTLFRYHPIYELNLKESLLVRSYEYLIKVDPEFHATRSSGQIISKISRGSQALWTITELIIFDILGLVISLISVSVALYFISPVVSLMLVGIFAILTVLSFIGFRLRTKIHFPVRTKAQDMATAVNVESMQQAQYIRASFSTEDQLIEMRKRAHENMVNTAIGWRWSAWIMSPQQVMYSLFSLAVVLVLWNLHLAPVILVGAMLSIYNFGTTLYDVGRVFDKVIQSFEDADDMFSFIRNFGKQSYPVLNDDTTKTFLINK